VVKAATEAAAREACTARKAQPLRRWPFWNCPAPKGTKLSRKELRPKRFSMTVALPAVSRILRGHAAAPAPPPAALPPGLRPRPRGRAEPIEEVDHLGRIQQGIETVVGLQLQELRNSWAAESLSP